MRHFNEKERQIINLLVEQFDKPNFVLLNVFNDWFFNRNIAYNLNSKVLIFDHSAGITSEQILEIEQDLCKRALFIQYLIDHNYITIIHDHTRIKDSSTIGSCESKNIIEKQVPVFLAHILEESCNRIYVLDSLVELKENDFLTYEAQQLQLAGKQLSEAKCQTRFSIGTFVASILTIFITTFTVKCSYCCCGDASYKDSPVNVKNHTCETIDSTLKNQIDSIIVAEKQLVDNTDSIIVLLQPKKKHAPIKSKPKYVYLDTLDCGGTIYYIVRQTK